MSRKAWHCLRSVIVAAVVLSSPPAGAIGGSATLDARELLKLQRCGREKGTTPAHLELLDDGRWSLGTTTLTLGGTYVAGGRGDRKLTLTLGDDAPLRAYLEARLTTQCGEGVSGVVLEARKLRAKVDRRGTKIALALLHRISAPAKGKHKLAGKGPLEPLPSTTSTLVSSTTTTTVPPPCANGVQDGNETAVDCGGGECPGCADGEACVVGTDCLSTFCPDGTCTDPCATQPAGTSCADDGNACTVDECDGSTCQHTPAGEGTVCRPVAGVCDVAEVCDGSGAPCPGDAIVMGGVCRPSAGDCDVEETCDGSSPECPADLLRLAGSTCRIPVGVCDVAETCDGVNPDCPTDAFLGPETVCRAVAGACDEEETCDGSGPDCPDDLFNTGNVCRAAVDACDAPETCAGTLDCPPDGPPIACFDAWSCTVDFCDPVAGCKHQTSSNRCDDANVCTIDFCTSGGFPGADPQTGCYHVAGNFGGPCGTGIGQCDTGGNCVVPGCEDCSDGYSCTDDSCDQAVGCVHQGVNARCDDGNVCTTDLCTGAPGPDPQTGCVHAPANAGVACDSGNKRCDPDGNCIVPGCTIDGVFYEDGERRSPTDCAVCDFSRATDAWSTAFLGVPCRPSTGVCDPTEVCNALELECPLDVKLVTPKYRALPAFQSLDLCSYFGEPGFCDGTHGACQPLAFQPCDKDCYQQGQWERELGGGLRCQGYPFYLLDAGTYCGQALVNACVTKTCTYRQDQFGDPEAVCSPVLNSFVLPDGTVCSQEEFGTPGQVPYTPECKGECKCGKPDGLLQSFCIPTSSTAVLGSACTQDVDCAFEHRCVDGMCASATTRAIGEECVGGDTANPCSTGEFCCGYQNHVPAGFAGNCGNGCCADSECGTGRSCCLDDGCVDLENDLQNCGVCGNDCGSLVEQSACWGDRTVECVGGRCMISDVVETCDEGLLCNTVLNTASLASGEVIRREGTTEDYTVQSSVLGTVFATDSGGSLVQLQDVEGNFARCVEPALGAFPGLFLDPSLCMQCPLFDDCPNDLVCQNKCDGSWFGALFCAFSGGVCVPQNTVSTCE